MLCKICLASILIFLVIELKNRLYLEREISYTDSLTGLLNSRALYARLTAFVSSGNVVLQPFVLVFIDLDNFKSVNDTMGHPEGDRVLKSVSALMKAHFAFDSILARIGGDEFVCLLTLQKEKNLQQYLNKIFLSMTEAMQKNGWNVIFSVGALQLKSGDRLEKNVITMVDTLMYKAKKNGKNFVQYVVMP